MRSASISAKRLTRRIPVWIGELADALDFYVEVAGKTLLLCQDSRLQFARTVKVETLAIWGDGTPNA